MNFRKWSIQLFITFIVFLAIIPSPILAHPLDENGEVKAYDQKQILEISPKETKLIIDLTLYAVDKIKVWESIDKNRDQKVTDEEKSAWLEQGKNASWLTINGETIHFSPTNVELPGYYDFFGTKPTKVQIEYVAQTTIQPNDTIIYNYKGKDKKLEEIDFKANGNGLNVSDLAKVSPDSVSFSVSQGSGTTSILGGTSNTRFGRFLSEYVKSENMSMRLVLLALFTSFFLGFLHSLAPGHGKTIIASYLVGERATVPEAFKLGVIVTITHTSSVFILGLASIFLTSYIVPEQIAYSLSKISSIGIILFGLYLLYKRSKGTFFGKKDHEYSHDHSGSHHHDLPEETSISWKKLLPLGISGGIVPCIDALAILVVAISLHKVVLGMIFLLAFSLGLAGALISFGTLAVLAKEKFITKFDKFAPYEKYVDVVSALIIVLLGVALFLNYNV